MKLTAQWLDHGPTQRFCAAVTAAGHRVFFVGGCVRNAVLGLAASDADLATDALPDAIAVIAADAGFRTLATGVEHGTITVLAAGVPLEVTTFRADVETFGRQARVAFSTDILKDAQRRDFTMNALYADANGTVLDPLGTGLRDLQARRVCFVGDAALRITEDYLRILRFFRFYAHFGDPAAGIDAEGLAACAANLDGIDLLSRERIGAEMRKLLAAVDPAPAVASMAAAGVLARAIPGADATHLALLVDQEAGIAVRWQRRLALIGGASLQDDLRLSRSEATQIDQIRQEIGSNLTAAVLAWRLGAVAALDVLLLRATMFEQSFDHRLLAEIDRGALARFPVEAADLMPDLQGPALGARLKQLELQWQASDLHLTREELLN